MCRDIGETQNGLMALLGRVDEVTQDIKRLSEENAMLQVYLDNMTKNSCVACPFPLPDDACLLGWMRTDGVRRGDMYSAMFAGAKGDKR